MKQITDFKQLISHLRHIGGRTTVAVAGGCDSSTRLAMEQAIQQGIANFYLVGDADDLKHDADFDAYRKFVEIIDEAEPASAAAAAVRLVKDGVASVLMKGLINTDVLLRAILDKQNGILQQGHTLTHIAALEVPAYRKMLFVSDAAVIPQPTLVQRVEMIKYAISVCRKYGIERPRVALVHCTEKISKSFAVTMDYKEIVDMANSGYFGTAIVDGPIDLKCACSIEAAKTKGLISPIEGDADVLIMPEIESANAVYKALTLFAGAEVADALQGADCPVAVTSRSDSPATKYNSLAMAILTSETKIV